MPGVVAVGFFDGVHIGHRRILAGADAALTFKNHPSSILRPESASSLLMPYSEKEEFIRSCGVKNVIALDFTSELASMPPEKFIDFIGSYSKVRCGADWRFGRGAKGDAEFLRARGFEVEVVPYAELDGEPMYYKVPVLSDLSSSPTNTHIRIRQMTITGPGSSSPHKATAYENISFSLKDWIEDDRSESTNNL